MNMEINPSGIQNTYVDDVMSDVFVAESAS